MSDLHAMPITNIIHSACYTVEMGISAGDLDNNHTAYTHRLCQNGAIIVKATFSFAIITSYGNQITPAKHEDNLEIKV